MPARLFSAGCPQTEKVRHGLWLSQCKFIAIAVKLSERISERLVLSQYLGMGDVHHGCGYGWQSARLRRFQRMLMSLMCGMLTM